jgi:hypothetical protein
MTEVLRELGYETPGLLVDRTGEAPIGTYLADRSYVFSPDRRVSVSDQWSRVCRT